MTTAEDTAGEAATVAQRRAEVARIVAGLEQRYDREGNAQGPRRTLLNLERIIGGDSYYHSRLRYNGLAEVVEWEGRRMRDDHITWIRLAIAREYGPQYGAEDVQAICVQVARQATYHPVTRYLGGLMWDRVPRISGFLTRYLGVADTPLHRAISRRWFVSCVARAMGQGERPVKVDTVLVLSGKQGARKSTAFRVLAGDDWFSDTALDIRNKDAYQSIRGVWLFELAELAATRPRDAESVKAFLSAPTDRYRPPYGRNVVESHRQCVFVGTTNEATFLSDPTGARRFWPVSVGTIDIDAIRHDRGLLWAEAVEAYRSGESWWLDPDEDRALSDAQEQYQHEDPWLVTLDRWMSDAQNRAQASRGMRVGELLTQALHMDEDRQRKGDEMRFGAVLQGAGWTKRQRTRDGHRLRLWFPPTE